MTATLAVPAVPTLLGFRLGWQGVSVDPVGGGLRVSNTGIGLVG